VFSSHLCVPHISLCQHDDDDDDAHISSQCIVCENNLVRVTSLQAHAAEGCAICVSLLIHYVQKTRVYSLFCITLTNFYIPVVLLFVMNYADNPFC